MCSIMCNTNLW